MEKILLDNKFIHYENDIDTLYLIEHFQGIDEWKNIMTEELVYFFKKNEYNDSFAEEISNLIIKLFRNTDPKSIMILPVLRYTSDMINRRFEKLLIKIEEISGIKNGYSCLDIDIRNNCYKYKGNINYNIIFIDDYTVTGHSLKNSKDYLIKNIIQYENDFKDKFIIGLSLTKSNKNIIFDEKREIVIGATFFSSFYGEYEKIKEEIKENLEELNFNTITVENNFDIYKSLNYYNYDYSFEIEKSECDKNIRFLKEKIQTKKNDLDKKINELENEKKNIESYYEKEKNTAKENHTKKIDELNEKFLEDKKENNERYSEKQNLLLKEKCTKLKEIENLYSENNIKIEENKIQADIVEGERLYKKAIDNLYYEINNSNVFLKILYFFTGEKRKREEKIKKIFGDEIILLRIKLRNIRKVVEDKLKKEISRIEFEYSEALKREEIPYNNRVSSLETEKKKNILEENKSYGLKIKKLDEEAANKIKEYKEKEKYNSYIQNLTYEIETLNLELDKSLENLRKINLNLAFINSGDKELVKSNYYILESNFFNSYPDISKKGNLDKILKDCKYIVEKYKNDCHIVIRENTIYKTVIDLYKNNLLNFDYLKNNFVQNELENSKKLLDNIDGKSLDNQQRLAVITDEVNNLVIAGAGSGKTLTIAAKVKYLVDRFGVEPKDILLITFTKKAALEMQERINNKLNINVNVKTFHALGYDLLGYFEGKKPEIYEDLEGFSTKFINNIVLKDEETRNSIFKYFSTYMTDYKDPEDFESLGEYYRSNKVISFESIKFKLKKITENLEILSINKELDNIKNWFANISKEENKNNIISETKKILNKLSSIIENTQDSERKEHLKNLNKGISDFNNDLEYEKYNLKDLELLIDRELNKLREVKRTLKWEKVKSIEELIIANHMFYSGIDYKYEEDYKYNTADKQHRQYKPDFYLPNSDIYIEHFGINEKGKCPQYSKVEETKYLKGIEWKRELHRNHNTIMEETYSYYHKKGILIDKLEEIFKKHNVQRRKLTQEELIKIIKNLNTDNEFKEFYKLLNTFLNLFKSCNYNEKDIDEFINQANKLDNQYLKEKHTLFLTIFKKYYSEYTKELTSENKIDFSDMINKSIDYIKYNNKELPNEFKFKYIIIDEFQDISVARYKLIEAIREKNISKIMAVGDDWQSIYKFTGSEISIFTKFEEYFGTTEMLKIEKTYRNSQQLINIAGKFVMSNKNQLKKNLKSDKKINNPVVLVDYSNSMTMNNDENKNSLVRRVMDILSSLNKESKTVLLLGRNNFDISDLSISNYFKVTNKNGETIVESNIYPHLTIRFMTIHKSKGLEADEVIVLNNRNNITGFPNQMTNDSVLSYVSKEEENYLYAEERRLFYVALTRTRNRCYLMCSDENSLFTEELKNYKNIEYWSCENKEDKIYCPICKTGHLVKRESNGRMFYGCNNFPQCNFSTNGITNIKSKVRCPNCGNFMTLRKGPYGEFYGCNSFPDCKTTYSVEEFNRLDK